MVDINLFDDEEEKSGKQENDWDSPPGKQEGKKSESFKDELNLDDDFGSTASLGDEALLGEEVIPELDESGPEGKDEGSGYRDSKKKTPAIYMVILALVVVIAVVYAYFLMTSRKGAGPKSMSLSKTAISKRTPPRSHPDQNNQGIGKTGPLPDAGKAGSFFSLIDLARTVFDDLSKQGQFGAILLDDERFAVEYVSLTPGSSLQMGNRIKLLTGASEFKSSPEEKHSLNGKTTYWGVISGAIGKKGSVGNQPATVKFSSAEQFSEQVKSLARQNKLTFVDVKNRFSGLAESRNAGFRVRGEGNKAQVLAWLEQIKKLQPVCTIRTLFLVPMDYFDQKADNIKLVLDLSVSMG